MNYFKAWDKSGNFTLSQGKFTLKEVGESEVSSKCEVVQLILAIFLVRDGDTFLFNVDQVHCLGQLTDWIVLVHSIS